MRLSSIQWLLYAALSTVSAATVVAKVVVFDSDASSPTSVSEESIVNPDTARLILAERIGLGAYHSIASQDEEAIRHINAFTSPQKPLFAHDSHTAPVHRLLVMVEGVDYDAEKEIRASIPQGSRTFSVSPAPHPADAQELYKTFNEEARSSPRTADIDGRLSSFLRQLDFTPTKVDQFDGHNAMLRLTVAQKDQMKGLHNAINGLLSMTQSRPSSLTIIFIPPMTSRPSKTPFGLSKSRRSSNALRAPEEEPLISPSSVTDGSFVVPEPVSPNFAPSTKVLSGAIPTCFSSLSACQRGTQNCTAHGECILKYSTDTTNDGGSVSKQDCYGCACTKPDVRKNKDGTKKTTRYGGAACHKKDVVFPFWLLAGTTIGIIGVITFGLGMLYEMGNQELPSVIGAGVSGPKAGGR